jgi:hypothetical protein
MSAMQQVATSVMNSINDLTQLGQPVAWAVIAYFLRDIYRDHKQLREDIHGKGGISERLVRVETRQEVTQP